MYRFTYLFLCMLILLGACTKDVTFGPEVSNSRDWAPQIELEVVGYQRFHISISAPQSSLVSAIRSYIIRATGVNGTNLEFIDEVDRISGLISGYISRDAILEEGGEYEITVTVRYIDDVRNESNTLTVQSSETPGDILDEIRIPSRWNDVTLRNIVIWDGAIYRLFGDQILKLDISTEDVSFIPGVFIQDLNNPGIVRLVGGRNGKVLFAQQTSFDQITYRFAETDLLSGASRAPFSLSADFNAWFFEPMAYNGSQVLMLVKRSGLADTELEFQLYNVESGALESTFPPFRSEQLDNFAYYELVGDTIWRTENRSFDNRLQKIDPQTGQILQEFHIPVFASEYLHYNDGFWVTRRVTFDDYSTEALKIDPAEF